MEEKVIGQLGQEVVLSEEAINRGFRIEDGKVVKYSLDRFGNLLRRRKNWRNSERAYSRQFIKDACELCNCMQDLTIHHIVPLSKGGSREKNNCITLCRECHVEVHQGIKKIKKKGHSKVLNKSKKKPFKKIEGMLVLEETEWGGYRIID